MLATMPSGTSHNIAPAVPVNAEEDRLCAGCNLSVSSETGGVVVAFGQSLWHVDCFKCAKCGNQVNADTNLLLLSDGSPVCANCYNCKVCNLPILDEAVMTGDDSYHAACFTCRSCKNRIDELVFAKTSQGFYCMKCHNDRVARSRRHMAKHKQRERERAALGSSSGRSTGSTSSRHRPEEEQTNGAYQQDSLTSNMGRRGYTSGGSSNDDHSRSTRPLNTSHSRPNTSGSINQSEQSVVDASFMSTNSAANATMVPLLQPSSNNRAASPVPPSVSISVAGPTSTSPTAGSSRKATLDRSRADSQPHAPDGLSRTRPSLDGPPPYSVTPPPKSGNSGVDSARSSTSYSNNNTSGPVSPSLTAPTSHEGSVSAPGGVHLEQSASTSLPYLNGGAKERPQSPTEGGEQSRHAKRYDDGTRPLSILLQPSSSGLAVAKDKRSKRGSINPGLQLEASKLLNFHSERTSSAPSSPNAPGSASSPPGSHARTQSPTNGRDSPRVASPLRDYFVGAEADSSGSTSTSFYSPAPSPQLVRGNSPTSPRSASAQTSAKGPAKEFLSRLPPRGDSLNSTLDSAGIKNTVFHAPERFPPPTRSSPSPNGSLNAPKPMLRTQRSFDERGGRLSPRKAEFGVESGKRSRSVSPKPPDVPRSIESGTDTETDLGNESDDITQCYMDSINEEPVREQPSSRPPALPPKDGSSFHVDEQRNRSLSLSEMSINEEADVIHLERTSPDSPNPMSSMESRTSGFFIAPALPPMRFSMNGADFRDILNNLGGASPQALHAGKRESQTVTITEEKSDELSAVRTPTSIASTVTPESRQNDSSNGRAEKLDSLRVLRSTSPDTIIGPYENGKPGLSRSASISPSSPIAPETPRKISHRASRSDTAVKILDEPTSPRSKADASQPTSPKLVVDGFGNRKRLDSYVALQVNGVPTNEQATPRTSENSDRRPSISRQDSSELVSRRLKEALADASERGSDYIKLDRSFIEAILSSLEQKNTQVHEISTKLDGMKRTSQMMFDGLSVAQEEYDQECQARRNAEAEVSRLKIELSGQAARLTALQGDDRRREVQKQLTQELSKNLFGLEKDLSKLKVERDMTLAEVEELSVSKGSQTPGEIPVASVSRSLTMRLDNIKKQYQHELVPLTQQREALFREIAELKEARDIFLEETAVLNARNEELAQLNTRYERRSESTANTTSHSKEKSLPSIQSVPSKNSFDTWKARQAPPIVNTTSTTSTSSSTTLYEDPVEIRPAVQKPSIVKIDETPTTQRTRIGLRWPGNKLKEIVQPSAGDNNKGRKGVEHAFQQLSILRFARCDHCGDKMWGSQVRCSACNLSVHVRCVNLVQTTCMHDGTANGHDDHMHDGPPPPSMFKRDLVEQVRADAKGSSERFIPVIVEKCIDAVETSGMDYEGIYRKTGGTSQSRFITSLFERGNYEAFDLRDSDTYNDISSVTSVLKNYFRDLPNPLLTFTLHEAFVSAAVIRDPEGKAKSLKDLVTQLPSEHYHTLSYLMLHLHRVQQNAETNLMTARNLGVIFGPTLMRSRDASREFADMAGKSLAIEWLIENAPTVFGASRS